MKPIDTILDALDRGSAANVLAGARNPALFQRHAAALAACEARARAALAEPIPPLPWSKFRLFKDTGNRSQYESPYFARRVRLADLVICLLAGRDADGALLRDLEDLLWALCDECTWALPAHLWGNRPMPIELDLFSTETSLYLSELLHLVGDRLDPRVVARCRGEIRRRILDSFLADYPRYWWEQGTNNWGAVCADSIGITFLYEESDSARRRAALARVLATMDRFLDSFPSDGVCVEGGGYWTYGFGHFVVFADFVLQYTNGAVDLFDDPRAHRIARFPQCAALSQTRFVSFADGSRFRSPTNVVIGRLAARYADVTPCSGVLSGNPTHKLDHLVRAFLWCDPAQKPPRLPDQTTFFNEAQWLVVRHAPFAFAALFGHNGVPHNHNDVGSFLMVEGDDEGPMDLGCGEYTRQYFSAERYTILCNGSQGHSVPIVGGELQKAGGQYGATDVVFEEKADETLFSGDIAGAYGLDALASLRRTFRIRPAEGTVTVADAFAFNGAPPSVTERFVGYAAAEVTGPGAARFGAFDVRFDPALKASVRTEPMSPHGTGATTVTLLDIEVPAGAESFEISFRPSAR